MENKHNLLDVAFITTVGGEQRLEDVFTGKIKALCCSPDEWISLFYFFLGLCQYYATPENTEAWKIWGPEGMGTRVWEGLMEDRGHFWLIGDKPFMQHWACKVPVSDEIKRMGEEIRDKGKLKKQIQKALLKYPDGYIIKTTSTFSTHEFTGSSPLFTATNIPHPCKDGKELFKYVITFMGQAALGGKKPCLLFPPRVFAPRQTPQAGPAANSRGSTHCFLGAGNSLLEDLWLNLLTKEDLVKLPQFEGGVGVPYFKELPIDQKDSVPEQPEKLRGREKSLLGLYMPMPRFFLLGENIIDADGNDRKGMVAVSMGIAPAPELYSPFCLLSGKKDGTVYPFVPPNGFRFSKEIQAVSLMKKNGNLCPGLDMCLERMCSHLEGRQISNVHLHVMGMSLSNKAGEHYYQGRDDLFSTDVSIPLRSVKVEEWFDILLSFFDTLEKWEKNLAGKVGKYCEVLGRSKEDTASRKKEAIEIFWRLIDPLTIKLFNACTSEEPMKKVEQECKACLYKTYEKICPSRDSLEMKARYSNYPLTKTITNKDDCSEFSRLYACPETEGSLYKRGLVSKVLSLQDKRVRSAIRRSYEDNAVGTMKAFLMENGVEEDAVNSVFAFEAYRTVLSSALREGGTEDGKCSLVEVLWNCRDDEERGYKRVYNVCSSKDGLDLCEKLRILLKLLPCRSEKKLSYESLLCELLTNPWIKERLARNYYKMKQEG